MISLDEFTEISDFKKYVRYFISKKTSPSEINWGQSEKLLFDESLSLSDVPGGIELNVSRDYSQLVKRLSMLRGPERWALLYKILYRLKFENKNLLNLPSDPDIRQAHIYLKSIARDIHKMHAFVRFKKIDEPSEKYVAWHGPEHKILRAGAPFFKDRFGDKPWSIFTPDESAHWDGTKLFYSEGMSFDDFKHKDDWDEVWKDYYRSIYNPARLNIKMMKQEMSPKYWKSMPEAEIIEELIKNTPDQLQKAAASQWFEAKVDKDSTLDEIQFALSNCTACPLYEKATQAVPGSGPVDAKLVILGEQPGDLEDTQGRPFVGPSGALLMDILSQSGIDSSQIYFTNTVKHFSFRENAKGERIHRSPTGKQIHACKPWLEAELNQIKPRVILALGVTAATAVLGKKPKLSQERGEIFSTKYAKNIIISWHPSSILRTENAELKRMKKNQLAEDIQRAFHLSLLN
ncbi:MAG: hypothetical protein CME62_00835 [Halobacteriovoraceae bacterium]|nr:hypothetical protein [Halobacteriovoraceae bacterium]|tara:strand:+ start:1143 stop:2525 length:1383 start_codon:yes stop_codon:yes gene_type:complete